MKTKDFINELKKHGIIEIKTKSLGHRKFNNPNKKLNRPIIISRSAMTKEVPEYIVRNTFKDLGIK